MVCMHALLHAFSLPFHGSVVWLQARQVRQSAAQNLGELTRMSMRVDQLATDLINNAKMADPAIQEAYLTALRGMLLSTGHRLSPTVLSKAGEALQSMMSSAGKTQLSVQQHGLVQDASVTSTLYV